MVYGKGGIGEHMHELIDDGEGNHIYRRTAEVREAAWEYIDDLTPGQLFTIRDVWLACSGHYGQISIAVRKAREVGWIRPVAFALYARN